MAHVYHWKHGWIPLDHTAALSKAKGDREAAAALLADAHSHRAGIHSKQDVAKAALALHSVPASDRVDAHGQLRLAADRHGANDLLPGSSHNRSVTRSSDDSEHQFQMKNLKSADAVRRPDDHNFATLSDAALDAAIARAKASGSERLLGQLQDEKRRRSLHRA